MATKKTINSTDTESGFFRTLFGVKSPSALITALLRPLRDRHNKHYRDNYFHFWADLLLLMILVGLVIIIIWLLVWQPKPAFSLHTKSSSPEIKSGQVETFSITYENQEDDVARNAEITLAFPDNFIFLSATPADTFSIDSRTFRVGDIPQRDKGSVSFTGIIRGQPSHHQAIEVVGKYQYKGTSKKLLDSLAYSIQGSVLETQLSISDQAYTDTSFSGTFEIKNTGQEKLSDIYVSFPSLDFKTTTDTVNANGEIYIAQIEAGETQSIDIDSVATSTGNLTMTSITAFKINDTFIEQKVVNKQIIVTEPQLLVKASFDSLSVNSISSRPTIQLSLDNLEEEKLDNISLSIIPTRSDISVKNITLRSGSATNRGGVLYIDSLQPNQKESIVADIELQRSLFSINDSVKMNIHVAYSLNGKEYKYIVSAGRLLFNSNLSLNSGGYYYGPQGDQLGVGPIPPQVDIPTTYWVIWEINNLGNDIRDMQVSADLPANIVWTDQQSVTVGSLEYSPVTRRVLWKSGDISKGGGNYRASFAISLVPQISDVGSVPVLIKNINFIGQDIYTKAQISNNLPEITANIESDKLSSGKGTVIPTE